MKLFEGKKNLKKPKYPKAWWKLSEAKRKVSNQLQPQNKTQLMDLEFHLEKLRDAWSPENTKYTFPEN